MGLTLAAAIIAAMVADGWLARPGALAPIHADVGKIGHWLRNGAISAAIVLVLTLLAAHELITLARGRGYKPFGRIAVTFAAVLVIGPYFTYNLRAGHHDDTWGLFWMTCAVAMTFVVQARRHRTENALENLATTIFILFYTGGLASFLVRLRMEVGGSAGAAVVVFSVFVVKMTDTGAYFSGRALGRHRLIEWLSPKKTWEGFVGGILTAVLSAVVAGLWLHAEGLAPLDTSRLPAAASLALLGLCLGLFSVAGDLCASLLKRDAQVKDSGQALPGLGGVLDVLDSPLIAAPFAWLFWTRMFAMPAG